MSERDIELIWAIGGGADATTSSSDSPMTQ